MENVTDLIPADDDFEFFFKVQCNSCHEEHPKHVALNRVDERELSGSKGNTAHFVWRCGNCKRESSAKFDSTPLNPYTSENEALQPLLTIECRGLEFVGFDATQGTWKCVGSNGTKFDDVDLGEGEWVDYDEKAALPVRVAIIGSSWARAP